MPKINPKSVLIQSSQNRAPTEPKATNPGRDLLFAALFGDEADKISNQKEVLLGSAASGGTATVSLGHNDVVEHSNEELLALLADEQSGGGLGKKTSETLGSDLENNYSAAGSNVFFDEENSEAIALSLVIDPAATSGEPLTKMLFDGRSAINNPLGKRLAAELGSRGLLEEPANCKQNGGNSGVVAVSSALITKASADFIGPMPANQNDGRVEKQLATLRTLRASNLDQSNADIDAELLDVEASEMFVKSEKKILTASSLKQAMGVAVNFAMTSKMMLGEEKGQKSVEASRANSNLFTGGDDVSTMGAATAKSSSNGQTGGQNSQHNSGHPGTPTGGSLLNNLNALQALDTAKGNWTEMLLQRVQKGLAGGKDQLDFQLNPRNLGKMRITLVLQNDRTNVQIQTETSAAASMLSESEARLAQMLEASGLRLGSLNSGQFHGFGGNASDQHAAQQYHAKTQMSANAQSGNDEDSNENLLTTGTGRSKNLINIQA